jgi:hypothetical protein
MSPPRLAETPPMLAETNTSDNDDAAKNLEGVQTFLQGFGG